MKKDKFKTFYGQRPESPVCVLDHEQVFVDQSEAEMCSLKSQLQRFGMDGLMARMMAVQDKFGYADTRLIPSFAELQNRIVQGNQYFMALPSEVRAEFNNDSGKFYTYVENNPEKAIERGFATKNVVENLEDLKKTSISALSDKMDVISQQLSEIKPKKIDEVVDTSEKESA